MPSSSIPKAQLFKQVICLLNRGARPSVSRAGILFFVYLFLLSKR
nr:MAG TPA: hypothetical protein [Caudoviricetes sp.]